MAKSPCIGCEFELVDKNNPTCQECDQRVEYVALIGGQELETADKQKTKKGAGRKTKKRNAMKNKLLDLNDYMFAQMERLSDKDLKGDKLTEEIQRSHAITSVAGQIISNAGLVLKARVAVNELLLKDPPKMLGVEGFDAKE